MDAIVAASIFAITVLVALVMGHRLVRQAQQGREEERLGLLQQQVDGFMRQAAQQSEDLRNAVAQSLQGLSGQVAQALGNTNTTLEQRLSNTTRVIGDVRQQLGHLNQSSARIVELGRDIARLDEILRPPKLRGALGELFLGELLAQILPPAHFKLQYVFHGGETVDAVVILRAGIVPIDAKFPLENFRRILDADSDEKRNQARRTFIRNVKGHIDAIAQKYIRTDEGTFDFALMYIPAENVYYETIIKEDAPGTATGLFAHALQRRVIPVSPNSFHAYLQTIVLGLKGMRVEEGAREIIDNLARIQREFNHFAEAFRLVGQHLDNSTKKFQDAQKRFTRMEFKVEQIDGLARGLQQKEDNGAART